GKELELAPALATRWEQPEPTVWRFHLREGVTFAGGEPFTADDVIFSLERARMEGSDMGYTIASVIEMRKVDDFTVDLVTAQPNPILPVQITSTYMMSKAWAEENGAESPASVRTGAENFASANANGTGAFRITARQPGVRTVFEPNESWWGEPEHNLTEVIFTPIESNATRVAALLSGEIDMMYPVPEQDAARINATGQHSVLQGFELRTIFLNMDQGREELLDSSVTGANPLKDLRVRQAIYQAIDIEALRDRVMGGTSRIAGTMVAPGINGYDPSLDERLLPFDPAASQALLADAGYPDGFAMGMDCPNDRYVNDERICQAIVGMLARVGIEVDLLAQTRSRFFEKILARDTTFSLLGWQPLSFDAHSTLQDIIHTPVGDFGTWNVGSYSNPEIDALTVKIETETDPEARQALISQALGLHREDIGHIPLHQAGLAWGVRDGVEVVLRSDDSLELKWVRVD
ncbi:MAG: ABC transporter substrate-binding protein, partial [Rhodobacteraceae bacterium]